LNVLRSFALLACRLILGGIFVVHGFPKLFGGPGKPVDPTVARYLGSGFAPSVELGGVEATSMIFRGFGLPFPHLFALVVGLAESVGGILLILGLLTRPAALALAIDMAVATRQVHWRNGLLGPGGFETPVALLAGCIALLGTGPGSFSLDELLGLERQLPVRITPTAATIGTAVATAGIARAVRSRARQLA
jgi:putative oxidoreductase